MSVSFYHTVKSFSQFLLNWILKGGKLVDQNTANMRAAICAGCHNNKSTAEINKTGGGCCGKGKVASMVINATRASVIKDNKLCHVRQTVTRYE